MRAGVSVSGSTLRETMITSLPTRGPRSFATLARLSCVIGHMAVQDVKKPVTMATRPFSNSLVKRRRSPFCVTTCASGSETLAGTGQPWSCAVREPIEQQKITNERNDFMLSKREIRYLADHPMHRHGPEQCTMEPRRPPSWQAEP